MKNKSSSSDSEGTRAAAAAAVASRSLSGTSRDAAERLLSRPGAAAAASAALTEKGRAAPAGGSFTSQVSVALGPPSGLLAIPQPGAPIVAGVTATLSQNASPKSSIGGRSMSSGSSGCASVAACASRNVPRPRLGCTCALLAFALRHVTNCDRAALSPMLSWFCETVAAETLLLSNWLRTWTGTRQRVFSGAAGHPPRRLAVRGGCSDRWLPLRRDCGTRSRAMMM